MSYSIVPAKEEEYGEITNIWEASVLATHTFLTLKEVEKMKPLVRTTYLYGVKLFTIKDLNEKILGFVGIDNKKLEMLFLYPTAIGHGLGKRLVEFVIREHQIDKVDVNEENPKALQFYQKMGFSVYKRNKLDGQGEPHPILLMKLTQLHT